MSMAILQCLRNLAIMFWNHKNRAVKLVIVQFHKKREYL